MKNTFLYSVTRYNAEDDILISAIVDENDIVHSGRILINTRHGTESYEVRTELDSKTKALLS